MSRLAASGLCLLFALGPAACAALPTRGGAVTRRTTVTALLRAPDAPRRLVCGHRGAYYADSPLGGGNTTHAFERAVAAGADLLEVDVERTADGVPVVAHDAWPRERSLEAWRERRREPMTLRALLDWSKGRVVLLLDAKTDQPEALARVVRKSDAIDRVVVLADPESEHRRLRAAEPTLALMARPRDRKAALRAAVRDDPHLVLIHVDVVWADAEVLRAIREGGRLSFANSWTVAAFGELLGAERSAATLFQQGIDVVQTNDPAGAARARDALARRDAMLGTPRAGPLSGAPTPRPDGR